MSENKILCFGELLLRFVPTLNQKWLKENYINAYVGGAEFNVAAALAKWGHKVGYFTCMPQNDLTSELVDYIQNVGIETSCILYKEGRLGTFYLPKGADMKNKGVIYDRVGSSFSKLQTSDIDWDTIFLNVDWFHTSAITPPLSPILKDICLIAMQEAKKRNIITSIDLNYRVKLWEGIDNPSDAMHEIISHCDVIMGNIWSLEVLGGISLNNHLMKDAKYDTQAKQSAELFFNTFTNSKLLAFTFRFEEDENDIFYHSNLYTPQDQFESFKYKITKKVDKVGSGDCFMAALISGYLTKESLNNIIQNCTKAAVSKLCEEGDHTKRTWQEMLDFINNNFRFEDNIYIQKKL